MNFKTMRTATTMAATAAALIGVTAPAASAAENAATHPVRPDINRVNCLFAGDPLEVIQSSSGNVDCFENAGAIPVQIYHIDWVYTGNNGTDFTLGWEGRYYPCYDSKKDTVITASDCGVPWDEGTMVRLEIYPGR